ncbi:cathepsin propeptide inhibitor domain protein [Teladorsagia circumcincta]|uniref:Cathepsin propeptide inhibitor domain protein n=1 Tax=Teladorsagia circumcincta TaxID=45464 RepID=A0A2G9UMA0_TELCI|nr:cathepsin propeptide inhibitor domain protein [Teladorsagia circumcincta]
MAYNKYYTLGMYVWFLFLIPHLFAAAVKQEDSGEVKPLEDVHTDLVDEITKGSVEYSRLGRYINPNELNAWNQFTNFIERHGKSYSSESEALERFRIFKRNLEVIRTMQENEQGTAVYGITRFADLSPEEFKKVFFFMACTFMRIS